MPCSHFGVIDERQSSNIDFTIDLEFNKRQASISNTDNFYGGDQLR